MFSNIRMLLISSVLCLLLISSATADTENGFYYSVTDGQARVTGYSGTYEAVLEIPETLGGYPVTTIGSSAFSNKIKTECSVILPDTVTLIEDYGFKECSGLVSISFGNGLSEIGDYAFIECTALEMVHFPDTLTAIGLNSFEGCTAMTGTLVLPASELSLNNRAFKNCTGITGLDFSTGKKRIRAYVFEGCLGLTGDLTIPANVTLVDQGAFSKCKGLNGTLTIESPETDIFDSSYYTAPFEDCYFTKVIAPGAIYTGSSANMYAQLLGKWTQGKGPQTEFVITGDTLKAKSFSNADNVFRVTLDEEITKIPYNAFVSMSAPFTVSMPGVTQIDSYAFSSATGLTELELPNVNTIASNAFNNCTSLKKLVFGADVTTVDAPAFSGCTALTEIKAKGSNLSNGLIPAIADAPVTKVIISAPDAVPANILGASDTSVTHIVIENGVTAIEANAFAGYTNLKSIIIPDSVTSIGENAFKGCTGLTNILLPAHLTTLGDNAFKNCTGLTSITLPETALTLGSGLFQGCSSLTSVTLPEALTAIPDYCFSGCTALPAYTLSEKITSIGAGAFENCTLLKAFTVPAQITRIEDKTFAGCTALQHITMPDQIASIGSYAFSKCPIDALSFPAALTSIGAYAFQGIQIKELVIPDTVTDLGQGAFCDSAVQSVTFPAGITDIPDEFLANAALLRLVIPEGVKSIGNEAFYDSEYWDWEYTLISVDLPESLEEIDFLSFTSAGNTVFYVPFGSPAYDYVVSRNLKYKLKPFSPESISISLPGGAALGKTRALTIELMPEGLTLDMFSEPQIIFTSSDPSVISVDDLGTVRMLKPGTATITAQDKDDPFINDTLELTVRDSTATKLTAFVNVSNSSGSVYVSAGARNGAEPYSFTVSVDGKTSVYKDVYKDGSPEASISLSSTAPSSSTYTKYVSVTVTDALGNTDTASGSYSCSMHSKQVGIGKPVVQWNGSTYVYTYPEGYRTEYYYTYSSTSDDPTSAMIDSITVEEMLSLKVGEGQWLECKLYPPKEDPYDTSDLIFFSDHPDVIDVSEDGLITAKDVGQATITIYATDGGGAMASCQVLCVSKYVFRIDITAEEVNTKTATQQLNAAILPPDASLPMVKWSSSDPSIATVDENGLVTWLTAGKVLITASAIDGSYVEGRHELAWEGNKVEEIILNLMPNGQQLTWRVLPENATNPMVTFQVDNPSMLQVDEAGYLRFLKEGTANVRAVAQDGSKVTATIQVSGSPKHTHIPFAGEIQATPATGTADGFLPGWTCVICNERINGRTIRASHSITLPAHLQLIEADAFMGLTQIEQVWIEDGITTFGEQAFAGCTNLILIRIPDSASDIAKNAFSGCGGVTILCTENSTAQQFAEANGYPYTLE